MSFLIALAAVVIGTFMAYREYRFDDAKVKEQPRPKPKSTNANHADRQSEPKSELRWSSAPLFWMWAVIALAGLGYLLGFWQTPARMM